MTRDRRPNAGCRVRAPPPPPSPKSRTLNPDGVFSNGPGDLEQAGPEIELLRQVKFDAG